MAVGYRWILYEYNTWLVSANAEECVIAEKHLTDTIFWQIGSLDPTRPNPTTGQPDPRPALVRQTTARDTDDFVCFAKVIREHQVFIRSGHCGWAGR